MQDGTRLVRRASGIAAALAVVALAAKAPWNAKEPEAWTAEEAEQVLNSSPWAQAAEATFPDPREREAIPPQALPGPAQAGMANARGVSDGRWDGGVGYNRGGALPVLQVLVRWDSAEPMQAAYTRLRSLGKAPDVQFPDEDTPSHSSDYVLTVIGLVPARTGGEGQAKLDTQSSSSGGGAAASNPERLLEDFMTNSRLAVKPGASVSPRNVQLDSASGAVRLFFPRSLPLDAKTKEAVFSTRYGAFTIHKRFRLNDLAFRRRLQL